MKFLPYIFLFLIGFQAYLLMHLLSPTGAGEPSALLVSVLGVLLAIIILIKKQSFSSYIKTMAFTAGVLSATTIITYTYTTLIS
ncbi:hypothetical protein LGQ02_03235 [Bacillus shivajii]|uniref:hypothetical protein n=1 Tax=Bacillus shivajii TaxID=1983719 RepID=UPI001CFBB71B|nr:hypothetical protein [Bacillus shivajii]UCZ53814.1 hypothetical protein LGQ02_03235 [Bacillus shivajii]